MVRHNMLATESRSVMGIINRRATSRALSKSTNVQAWYIYLDLVLLFLSGTTINWVVAIMGLCVVYSKTADHSLRSRNLRESESMLGNTSNDKASHVGVE